MTGWSGWICNFTVVQMQPTFSAAKPRLLFKGRHQTGDFGPNYDVDSDGQQFVMIKGSEVKSSPTQINIRLNWFEELKRLAPTGTS